VTNFEVISHGKLHHVLDDGYDYEMIFVDEAHRFRNEMTQGYEMLHEICWTQAEKVVLVTATPLNNTIEDIYSQLKLFKIPRQSDIPGVPDLKKFFDPMITRLNRHNRTDPEYAEILEEVSEKVREKVLKHVMVRRTRSEVEKYYEEDLKKRGVSFPEVNDPKRIIYEFDKETDQKFQETLNLLQEFKYTRYTPLLYLEDTLSPLQEQSQKNVGGFMRVLLVKRLESSFFAFRNTIERFIESYQQFIDMVDAGTVYIGEDVDISELMDRDDDDEILEYLDEEEVEAHDAEDFRDEFREDLSHDLNLLHEIREIWQQVDQDPKLDALQDKLSSNDVLQEEKVLIFSESRETGEYLYRNLREQYGDRIIQYSSDGGYYEGEHLSKEKARDIVEKNFDPNHPSPEDDVRILISTDVLSEGINLHRSSTVLNYDLPWNPTKVLQRVGRVNRIGSENDQIHVFNIFPTSISDQQLGLEQNITAKIQAFHDILGEDARYLTEDEEISSHELFGETLLQKLEDKETYEGEREEGPSELKYLNKIREVRDEAPDLFEKIKRLPKKARTARSIQVGDDNQVLTFFRKDKLKKFYISNQEQSKELSFVEAAERMECNPETSGQSLPDQYYPLLNKNKASFERDQRIESNNRRKGGLSNEKFVIQILKANEIQYCQKFTDRDHTYINDVLEAVQNGLIPQQTTKFLKQKFENLNVEDAPLDVLQVLRKKIPNRLLEIQKKKEDQDDERREVILSEFLHAAE
jgi:superfamily II DNA/RNA helicase